MTTHMTNNLKPDRSVCDQLVMDLTSNIDRVDCVICLRALAKDAVIYGRERRAQRWK